MYHQHKHRVCRGMGSSNTCPAHQQQGTFSSLPDITFVGPAHAQEKRPSVDRQRDYVCLHLQDGGTGHVPDHGHQSYFSAVSGARNPPYSQVFQGRSQHTGRPTFKTVLNIRMDPHTPRVPVPQQTVGALHLRQVHLQSDHKGMRLLQFLLLESGYNRSGCPGSTLGRTEQFYQPYILLAGQDPQKVGTRASGSSHDCTFLEGQTLAQDVTEDVSGQADRHTSGCSVPGSPKCDPRATKKSKVATGRLESAWVSHLRGRG